MPLPIIPPKTIVRGPFLPESVEAIITIPMGDSLKLVGRGVKSGMSYDPVLSPAQLTELKVSPERESPEMATMTSDAEIKHIAVEFVTRYEEERGCVVENVENETRR